MSSPPVVAPELPIPGTDALDRRLTAEVAELEALSRFTVEGIAERAERVAAEAEVSPCCPRVSASRREWSMRSSAGASSSSRSTASTACSRAVAESPSSWKIAAST